MTPGEISTILWRLDRQDQQLQRIEQHAEKTNGRVAVLELWRARVEGAKTAMGWVQPLMIALGSGVAVALAEHFL